MCCDNAGSGPAIPDFVKGLVALLLTIVAGTVRIVWWPPVSNGADWVQGWVGLV